MAIHHSLLVKEEKREGMGRIKQLKGSVFESNARGWASVKKQKEK